MDFELSPKVKDLQQRLQAFMDQHVYPNEKRFHEEVAHGDRWEPMLAERLRLDAPYR